MAVTIAPDPKWPVMLRVTGDIEQHLLVPVAPKKVFDGETYITAYYLTLSDGTVLNALHDPEDPQFTVVVEGAGNVTVAPSGLAVTVDWAVEWISVASNAQGVALKPSRPGPLPLFDALALLDAA